MNKTEEIKLVVTDLDGTLLDEKGLLSDENRNVIIKLKEKGIKFAIATGRPFFTLKSVLKLWDIEEYVDAIIANNGLEVEVSNGPHFEAELLKKEWLYEILENYKHLPGNFCLYYDGMLVGQKMDAFMERVSIKNHIEARVEDLGSYIQSDIEKLLFACNPDEMYLIEQFYQSTNETKYKGFKSQEYLFEFMHPDVNKLEGVRTYCEYLGITTDNVAAFGDNSNDLEMVAGCRVGVVMENGDNELKKKASYLALRNDQSGFSAFINSHWHDIFN